MWHDMFALPVPVAEKILRALFVYLFLVVALRLAGKRELAQLSTFDFVVLLSVANAVQNGIIGNDDSITGAWIGAMTLFVANFALAFTIVRSRSAATEQPKASPRRSWKEGVVQRRRAAKGAHHPRRARVGSRRERRAPLGRRERSSCFRTAASRSRRQPDTATEPSRALESELHEIRALLEAR